MATVLHAGRTVISDEEGGWVFTPGHRGQDIQVVKMARSTRVKVKDMGKSGATHKLSVDFVGTQGQFQTFLNRLTNLYNFTTGSLSVPGFGSTAPCIPQGSPSISEQKALADNEYLYTIDMEFLEL